jgi:hypothetical protein
MMDSGVLQRGDGVEWWFGRGRDAELTGKVGLRKEGASCCGGGGDLL